MIIFIFEKIFLEIIIYNYLLIKAISETKGYRNNRVHLIIVKLKNKIVIIIKIILFLNIQKKYYININCDK